MKYYYVITDFYPDIAKADDYEEALVPYATYEEACAAIDATLDVYEEHNDDGTYKTFYLPDIGRTIAYVFIYDIDITRAFRFEVIESELGILKIR